MAASLVFFLSNLRNSRDRRGMPYPSGGGGGGGGAGGGRSGGHSYGHVYGEGYEDDYSYSQHQARTGSNARRDASGVGSGGGGGVVVGGGAGGLGTSVAPAERNGNKVTSSRYQDAAPRAWGDGSPARASPRYVASPVHTPSSSTTVAGQYPTAPAPEYERPPPYYYPGPA